MIVCITSSYGMDQVDQCSHDTPAPIETLRVIIPAADVSEKSQSTQNAISTKLPWLTDPFTATNTKRSHYSANLPDPEKVKLEEKIYELYFVKYLSEKAKKELNKYNQKDPNKYRLNIIFSSQNPTMLSDLEHYLSKLRRFHFLDSQHIRFAIVENFIYHTATPQKVATLNALESIFAHLDKKRTCRYLIREKAIPIIKIEA